MGNIWVKEFTGGLDTRRLPETTPGGVLIKAQDGHINRGGEFEQRAAFVAAYELPAGTDGIASDRSGLVVFGTTSAAPPGLPTGVTYQQLEHPTSPSMGIDRILSHDRYAGKIYVSVLYDDGSVYHFYNGNNVSDWFDGRARAALTILSGEDNYADAATATFSVTAGSSAGSGEISSVKVSGVSLMASAVAHTDDDTTTAAAVAAAITANTSDPNYTATSDGNAVIITAPAGAEANGRILTVAVGGDATVSVGGAFAGGTAEAASSLDDLTVDGVSIITAAVEWAGTPEATATAIASAINTASTSPDYEATAVGPVVNIIADVAGSDPNEFAVTPTVSNGLTYSPDTLAMADGVDSDAFTPGPFVKTVRSKVYAVADGLLHFSGIGKPKKWTTDYTGAGFIDLSTEDADADELYSLARYQDYLAVFAEDVTMIWYIDPDPALNTLSQVLDSTGTKHPKSVTQFGDSDVFYLDRSGLRSLRARDRSNAAATTDIGVPIDDLITAKIAELTGDEHLAIGLINPQDKRFWLIMKDEIFVFTFFENAKISAWSTYVTATTDGDTTTVFDVDYATVYNGRPYLRSGNTIYAYGGTGTGLTYDDTKQEVWLPYLDAGTPTAVKTWEGADVALSGLWEISAAADPTNTATEDVIARAYQTTYNKHRVPMSLSSTHLSLRLRGTGSGGGAPSVLSSAVLHFERADED